MTQAQALVNYTHAQQARVYCVLDYETRSAADLKKVGAFEYANHPSTRILCVGWRIGTRDTLPHLKTQLWSPFLPSPYGDLKRAILNPEVTLVAHNAFFEQVITRFVLSKLIANEELKSLDPRRWLCTASQARALALPGKLAEACAALALPVQKDMEGHKLMMKMSKPRPAWKKWNLEGRPEPVLVETLRGPRVVGGEPKKWNAKLSDLRRLMQYCGVDVDAEVELLLATPELKPSERALWELDQRINWRGFKADRPLVAKTLKMISIESKRYLRETKEITDGEVTSTAQRDATLLWLRKNGCDLPDLKAKTVGDAITAGLASGDADRLLRLRQAASKTSTTKYQGFEQRSRTDGRIRDSLVYHQASTGRWAGAGLQPHNFPRGSIGNSDLAASILADPETDLELMRLLYGEPIDVFSSLLRAMIVASDGKELHGGDFAGIEVRVLFWIAGHEAGLRAFREGRDLYREIAAVIYGVKLDDVTKAMREVGKRAILGCGFGMGADKFFETCKAYGQEVEPDLAEMAVKAYRSTHFPVPKLWSNLERAAIAAVMNPGKRYTINKTSWWVADKFLYCQLPSGRKLSYYDPSVRQRVTPWGEKRPALYHYDVHPKTKKWVNTGTYGGRLAENVIQATARDFMAEAMIRVERFGYEIILTVHDELLAERLKNAGSKEEFERIMSEVPAWGKGCPIKVEAWSGPRYKK